MDEYLAHCYATIIKALYSVIPISIDSPYNLESDSVNIDSLHNLVKYMTISDLSGFDCNYDDDGMLNSKYLEDKYEPAIIATNGDSTFHIYLFQGELIDSTHPYIIEFYEGHICRVKYYSSEFIETGKPIGITLGFIELYTYLSLDPFKLTLRKGDSVRYAMVDFIKHERIEKMFTFKFVD